MVTSSERGAAIDGDGKVGEIPAWTEGTHALAAVADDQWVPGGRPVRPDWRGRPISIPHTSAKDTRSGAPVLISDRRRP
jgi:hypothetical protein